MFEFDFANQVDASMVQLLLQKLDPRELDRYCNLLLLPNLLDRSYFDTVQSSSQ